MSAPIAFTDRRKVLRRRVRLLVAATITYNVVEAVIAIGAGAVAGSVALIGFGLDSLVEVASAAAVAWQFAARDPERREKTALRVIAWSFFALAAYVTVEALRALLGAAEADHSTVGIMLLALSVVVMPGLSLAQRTTGRELGSNSAVADSRPGRFPCSLRFARPVTSPLKIAARGSSLIGYYLPNQRTSTMAPWILNARRIDALGDRPTSAARAVEKDQSRSSGRGQTWQTAERWCGGSGPEPASSRPRRGSRSSQVWPMQPSV